MAHTYTYRGSDQFGTRRRGRITAVDRRAAYSRLARRGISLRGLRRRLVTDLALQDAGLVKPRLALAQIGWIFRNLASLQGSGLTLTAACEILADQRPGTRIGYVLSDLQADLEAGFDVADAFARRERQLGSVAVSMVEAGAPTGNLRPTFASIAALCESQIQMRSNVRRATVYPLVVVALTLVITLAMIVLIVPRFERIYAELGAELPSLTRAVMDFSVTLSQQFWAIPVTIALLAALVALVRRLPSGRAAWDWLVLRLPRIGPLLHRSISARSAATLGALLSNGVPMLDALELTGHATGNTGFERAFERVRDLVALGMPVGAAFAGVPQLPLAMQDLAAIGDASGTLPEVLERYAIEMRHDLEHDGEAFAKALEPFLIVAVGALIGLIIIAMYLPMFGLFPALG